MKDFSTFAARNLKHSIMVPLTNKQQYEAALMKWKADNNIHWYARLPEKPKFVYGEDQMAYARRVATYIKLKKVWETAPKPEDYGLVPLLHEHFEIRIGLVLRFGAQHVKLFGFRLMSELTDFEEFLFKDGFRYERINKTDGSVEIDIDRDYIFLFSEKSARFSLAIASSDGIHITGFYFYNDNGYKDEDHRVNTIADMHDFFMQDKRVVTKKIKSEKGCHNFIQDYIAPFEAARIQDDRFYITTLEEYKKLPKYRFPNIKSAWILFPFLILFYFGPPIYGLFNSSNNTESNDLMNVVSSDNRVYICTGPQSKSYHKDTNCYGLQSCSADIEETTVEQAKDEGRKPCRYCCK